MGSANDSTRPALDLVPKMLRTDYEYLYEPEGPLDIEGVIVAIDEYEPKVWVESLEGVAANLVDLAFWRLTDLLRLAKIADYASGTDLKSVLLAAIRLDSNTLR